MFKPNFLERVGGVSQASCVRVIDKCTGLLAVLPGGQNIGKRTQKSHVKSESARNILGQSIAEFSEKCQKTAEVSIKIDGFFFSIGSILA
jgi:UDP-N-acetylglucosamine enolpyruvyl transferase